MNDNCRKSLKRLINERGSDVLLKHNVSAFFADYGVWNDLSNAQTQVLKEMCSEGDIARLVNIKNKKKKEREFELRSLVGKYVNDRGRQEPVVLSVLCDLCLVIGVVASKSEWDSMFGKSAYPSSSSSSSRQNPSSRNPSPSPSSSPLPPNPWNNQQNSQNAKSSWRSMLKRLWVKVRIPRFRFLKYWLWALASFPVLALIIFLLCRPSSNEGVSNLILNNWAVNERGYRCVSASFDVSIENYSPNAEYIAVLQPYIEDRPMNIKNHNYEFEGYCAVIKKITSAEQKLTLQIPYYAMEYDAMDFTELFGTAFPSMDDMYAKVTIYEKANAQYKSLYESSREGLEVPEVYIFKSWISEDNEREARSIYDVHCQFVIENKKSVPCIIQYTFYDPATGKELSVSRDFTPNKSSTFYKDMSGGFYKDTVEEFARQVKATTLNVMIHIWSGDELFNSSNIMHMNV